VGLVWLRKIMKIPQVVSRHSIHVEEQRGDHVHAQVYGPNGVPYWTPARGEAFDRGPIGNLVTRLKLARDVFMGRADALYWDEQ
jgi:hypothetical protein